MHLYRVAPSLYNPILGLVWWYFQHSFAIHQHHPVHGVGRVTLSVCLRVLFSASNWRIAAPDPATGLTITLNLFTQPRVPTPVFPTTYKIHLMLRLCLTIVEPQSLIEGVTIIPITACVKSTLRLLPNLTSDHTCSVFFKSPYLIYQL